MAENQFPVFQGGQTLTAADLNQLREFLHQRDRLLGRLIGFGTSCGLDGSVTSSTLTIAPGLAVEQRGEPLVMAVARTVALPPTVDPGTFDFVTGTEGFSIVLEPVETVEPAPDCGEADCEGHAELHTRAVELRAVAGRITGGRFAFAEESLLAVEPLRLTVTSSPQGPFAALRDTIATRLTSGGSPLVDPALITALRGVSMATGDLLGVRGYKAAWLNAVLFATLDLLRCRALTTVACDRTTTRPGVVLGWVHQVGTAWVWECGYRHAWEPPAGLALALVGGTCGSPCDELRDELEGVLAGYAPPDPPPPAGGGGGIVFDPPLHVCIPISKCVLPVYPHFPWPPIYDIGPLDEYFLEDPLGPLVNPVRRHTVREYFGIDDVVYLDTPGIHLGETLGYDGPSVKDSIEGYATEHGYPVDVVVATLDEVEQPAFAAMVPAGEVSFADRVVLVTDDNARVMSTGRIPAARAARAVGTELPKAAARASEAIAATAELGGELESLDNRFQTLGGDVAGLQGEVSQLALFQQDTGQWRGQVDEALGGMGEVVLRQVDKVVGRQISQVQERVSHVEGALGVLTNVRPDIRNRPGIDRLDEDVARGMVTFAGALNESLRTLVTADNERTLGRRLSETERAVEELESVAAGGSTAEIGDAAVKLMDSLRTAVKASGIERGLADELDAQFDAVRRLLG